MSRVISWFSCGAASAYATYLAKKEHGEINIVYCKVVEEHPDSMRFFYEFQDFIGQEIEVIGDESFGYSAMNVFRKRRFIKNQYGAPCTMLLKKEQRKKYQRDDDLQVFGYTEEEGGRIDRFIDGNNEVNGLFPLYENGIGKAACLEWISSIGIELPEMYKLGYSNNNCIGCVKGGMGYFNAIRVDFPQRFKEMALLERELGHAILKDKDGAVYLDELEEGRGNFRRDQPPACGFTCEWKQEGLDFEETL